MIRLPVMIIYSYWLLVMKTTIIRLTFTYSIRIHYPITPWNSLFYKNYISNWETTRQWCSDKQSVLVSHQWQDKRATKERLTGQNLLPWLFSPTMSLSKIRWICFFFASANAVKCKKTCLGNTLGSVCYESLARFLFVRCFVEWKKEKE